MIARELLDFNRMRDYCSLVGQRRLPSSPRSSCRN